MISRWEKHGFPFLKDKTEERRFYCTGKETFSLREPHGLSEKSNKEAGNLGAGGGTPRGRIGTRAKA